MWVTYEWQLLFASTQETLVFIIILRRGGRILKLYKVCHTVSQSFLWKQQFCSIHILKQASIHGILFFSIENYLCRRLICNIWQWKSSLECTASFTCNIFLSQIQTDTLYDSFPNKPHSILSCNRCISLCCLLRLTKKKKINYFQQKPCCVLIRKEIVEELMVLR